MQMYIPDTQQECTIHLLVIPKNSDSEKSWWGLMKTYTSWIILHHSPATLMPLGKVEKLRAWNFKQQPESSHGNDGKEVLWEWKLLDSRHHWALLHMKLLKYAN